MIFSAHVALHSLSVCTTSLVDVLTGLIATNERYGSNVGVCANVGHSVSATLDDVHNAIGHTGLLQEIEEDFHGTGDLLRGLHYVSVTKSDCQREHPQWAHSGEVEGGNTSAHSQRNSVAVKIDTLSNVAKSLALSEGGEAASVLDNLETSENVALSVNK